MFVITLILSRCFSSTQAYCCSASSLSTLGSGSLSLAAIMLNTMDNPAETTNTSPKPVTPDAKPNAEAMSVKPAPANNELIPIFESELRLNAAYLPTCTSLTLSIVKATDKPTAKAPIPAFARKSFVTPLSLNHAPIALVMLPVSSWPRLVNLKIANAEIMAVSNGAASKAPFQRSIAAWIALPIRLPTPPSIAIQSMPLKKSPISSPISDQSTPLIASEINVVRDTTSPDISSPALKKSPTWKSSMILLIGSNAPLIYPAISWALLVILA